MELFIHTIFQLGINSNWCKDIDQPQHAVGEAKRPNTRNDHGCTLREEEGTIAKQQPIGPASVPCFGRKYTQQDSTGKTTDTVYTPDIQRIIPAQAVFKRNSVEANQASANSDQRGRTERHITGSRRDGSKTRHTTCQQTNKFRYLMIEPFNKQPGNRTKGSGNDGV